MIKQELLQKENLKWLKLQNDDLLEIGAYGEYMSNHPIARSIVKAYDKEIDSSRMKISKKLQVKDNSCY